MDEKTLEALKGSIAKWKAIVAGHGLDEGHQNCPLCKMYAVGTLSCFGCPVQAKSARSSCMCTPYEGWILAREDAKAYGLPINSMKESAQPKLRAAAQAELDFLRSLLPESA